ncbi:ATP-binding cassette domain-containing protein [bacterium]|nr:ATP-binding cassette domain-containing protein [bacterium]MBU4133682.1 ATP-binding cassette domain-containing protein [bacterium]
MIKLEDVKKYYGDFKALDGISFEIAKGEIAAFLGPNGAGKTTTMRIISNYFPASSGSVSIKGLSPSEGRRFIGYMPESNPLYPEMFVEDYLRYVLRLRGIKNAALLKNAVEKCSLKDVMSKKIGELSKGYRQRVGLAASIVHDPEILILDEPTIGLDPNQIRGIRALIKELGREKTVIISTHILSEAAAMATRIIIINEGSLVMDSPADKLESSFSSKIILNFEKFPEDIDALNKISGIENISRGEKEIEISYAEGNDIRGEVFAFCAAKKWKVVEMFTKKEGLEEIFKKLTGENASGLAKGLSAKAKLPGGEER